MVAVQGSDYCGPRIIYDLILHIYSRRHYRTDCSLDSRIPFDFQKTETRLSTQEGFKCYKAAMYKLKGVPTSGNFMDITKLLSC
jgi:hypothetical protein